MEPIRCRKCRRYLCSAIGLVEIKCPSCKTLNKTAVGDIKALARRIGRDIDRTEPAALDTPKTE